MGGLLLSLSKVCKLSPRSSKSFLNFGVSITRLLINWFLIKKNRVSPHGFARAASKHVRLLAKKMW